MEAQALTISIPPAAHGPVCDKNCPYCISKMTGYVKPDKALLVRNIEKVKKIANMANISSILLTGKGEPMLNFDTICYVLERFKEFPLEIQTNGLWLSKHTDTIGSLKQSGLDVIAISIDHFNQMDDFKEMIKIISDLNMTCRICLNLTDKIIDVSFSSIFNTLKHYNIHQLIIRNIMVTKRVQNNKMSLAAVEWINTHVDPNRYIKMYQDFKSMIDKERDLVRLLPYGSEVYDLDGISVSFSDCCIQENNNTKDIRSLIFLEDGHVYTSWDKIPASRLF